MNFKEFCFFHLRRQRLTDLIFANWVTNVYGKSQVSYLYILLPNAGSLVFIIIRNKKNISNVDSLATLHNDNKVFGCDKDKNVFCITST